MKKICFINFCTVAILMLFTFCSCAQKPANWTNKQLLEPAELATILTSGKDVPLIVCVGPGASIPNSLNIGMVNTKEGLNKFRSEVSKVPANRKLVIYCGCCPFEHCPNVRPAIDVLKELKFTNWYLLNLPHNIRKDWIDKGYPVAKE